jgi:hypothetical protein
MVFEFEHVDLPIVGRLIDCCLGEKCFIFEYLR